MTARDTALSTSHDTSTEPLPPRRRRSHSSKSPTPPISKRSSSPRITFTPTSLSSETKGVQNITRKVIRKLEGLGHLESSDMYEQETELEEETEEQLEVHRVLNVVPNGQTTISNGHANGHVSVAGHLVSKPGNGSMGLASRSGNGVNGVNGAAHSPTGELRKVDWEIPRKLLHSSIGFFTIYLYVTEGDPRIVVLVLWTALGIIVPADFLRLRYPSFERIYERFLGFLMRESEKESTNGVIWYILGVNFVLSFFPQDVATVAILILSWADTAASTIGRLFGSRSPRLPRRLPFLRLPLAPRKSLAGFLAASATGAAIAFGFWGWIAPLRNGGADVTWSWNSGVRHTTSLLPSLGVEGAGLGGAKGWVGLAVIGVVAGLVSGVAEALDVGSLDDNLTLPILAGTCIFSFFKAIGLFSST